jgi:DNA-directed RNA polymerase specialized sigma24 family protein
VLVDFLRRCVHESPAADVAALSLPSSSMPEPCDEPWNDSRILGVTEEFVAALQPPLRELYRHRFVDGLTQLATARAMGLSGQRIRTLENELLDSLRRSVA